MDIFVNIDYLHEAFQTISKVLDYTTNIYVHVINSDVCIYRKIICPINCRLS